MNKKRLINLICFILGLALNALGIRMIVYANFGTYPIDAIAIALFNIFGMTVGTWLNINSIVLIILASLIAREKPNLYCIGVSILFGFLYDLWALVLFDTLSIDDISFGLKSIVFISGAIINAIGVSIYLCPNWPVSALDNLMITVKNKFNLSFQISRILIEVAIAVVALLLDGPLGLGTFVLVLLFSSVLEIGHGYVLSKYNKII